MTLKQKLIKETTMFPVQTGVIADVITRQPCPRRRMRSLRKWLSQRKERGKTEVAPVGTGAKAGGKGKGKKGAGKIQPKAKPRKISKNPCRLWKESGKCSYGDRCIFKHGE